jgi:hypothetical protein
MEPDGRTEEGGSTPLEPPDPPQRFGAAAAEDAELADRLVEDADGDVDAAASEFEDASRGPVPTEKAHPGED